MNKRISILICVVFIFILRATAQKENNIWAMGYESGLDFNSGKPVLIKTSMYSSEGCASICDKEGNLLFYSNGHKVWDKNNQVTPNGNGLLGNTYWYPDAHPPSSTQGVGIIGFPENNKKFYVFVLDSEEDIWPGKSKGYLRYSIFDLTLNEGLGDIDPNFKNIIIDSFLSEKMTLVKGEGCFSWLLVHNRNNSEFHSYKIGIEGLSTKPVTSISGDITNKAGFYSTGEMKITSNHKMIGLCTNNFNGDKQSVIELHNFNYKTGMVSFITTLNNIPPLHSIYGFSFSPDNSKIYTSIYVYLSNPYLLQYDLADLADTTKLKNSKFIIYLDSTTEFLGAMRKGPDGKIYITRVKNTDGVFKNEFSMINNPDNKGVAMDFQLDAEIHPSSKSSPSYYLGIGNDALNNVITVNNKQILFSCDTIEITPGSSFSNYLWDNGNISPSIKVVPPAKHFVYSVQKSNCVVDTIETLVANIDFDLGNDIEYYCKSAPLILQCNIDNAEYKWSNGSDNQSIQINETGRYWVEAKKGNCFASDTMNVNSLNCNKCISLPNAFTPNNDGKNDMFKPIIFCSVKKYLFTVVNRYGEIVFKTNDHTQFWDGKFKNQDLDFGVYYYYVAVQFDNGSNKEEMYKGDISIFR